MIEFTKAYKTSDGKTFESVPEAQRHEIILLLSIVPLTGDNLEKTADCLLSHSDSVADILTTNGKSKPRARKVNGGTKKRTAVAPTT